MHVCLIQIFQPYHIKIVSAVPDVLVISCCNFRSQRGSPRLYFRNADFNLKCAQYISCKRASFLNAENL